jgi:hypothetical protein
MRERERREKREREEREREVERGERERERERKKERKKERKRKRKKERKKIPQRSKEHSFSFISACCCIDRPQEKTSAYLQWVLRFYTRHSPKGSCIEDLVPNVAVFRDGTFGE